jgi:hypothetical protein
MGRKIYRDADGLPHSRPGSVNQQSEDSFPASDAPTFSPGAVGAPVNRETPTVRPGNSVAAAEQKSDRRKGRKRPVF